MDYLVWDQMNLKQNWNQIKAETNNSFLANKNWRWMLFFFLKTHEQSLTHRSWMFCCCLKNYWTNSHFSISFLFLHTISNFDICGKKQMFVNWKTESCSESEVTEHKNICDSEPNCIE